MLPHTATSQVGLCLQGLQGRRQGGFTHRHCTVSRVQLLLASTPLSMIL